MTDLDRAIKLAFRIDEAIRKAVTEEVLTLPGVDVGNITIFAPGRGRLVEDLWLARRTFTALHFLMLNTARSTTPAGDLTESASVLGRRLFELLGQVSWLTDFEPPEALTLPASFGNPDRLAEVAGDVLWPETDRRVFCSYVAAATTWIDIQALRAERGDLRRRRLIGDAIGDIGSTKAGIKRQNLEVAILRAQDKVIEQRLTDLGAPMDARYDMISLLKGINPQIVLAYRYESDVAHAGAVGRLHQRGARGEPTLGAAAPEERRLMVARTANAVMICLAERVLRTLGGDTDPLDQVAKEHHASMATADQR